MQYNLRISDGCGVLTVPAPGAGLALDDAAFVTPAELDVSATSCWGYDLLGRVVSAENGHAQGTNGYDGRREGLVRMKVE